MGAEISYACNCNSDARQEPGGAVKEVINNSELTRNESQFALRSNASQGQLGYETSYKDQDIPRGVQSNNLELLAEKEKNLDRAVGDRTVHYENGDEFKGNLIDGKKEGYGTYKTLYGSYYEGNFKMDEKHGHGKLTDDNNLTYIGKYSYYYIGMFSEGKKCGQGRLQNRDGKTIYLGEWFNDFKHGQGKEYYIDGSVYEGLYQNGKKNGIGKYILNAQSFYEGNFKDDKMHGQGKFKWSESKIYEGEWRENCLCGYGVFKKQGKLYKGYFYNDKKHGKGAYFYHNNSYMISNFKENNPMGLSIFYSEDKGEQIVFMEGNKVVKTLTDQKEIDSVKQTSEYEELQKFFEKASKDE